MKPYVSSTLYTFISVSVVFFKFFSFLNIKTKKLASKTSVPYVYKNTFKKKKNF